MSLRLRTLMETPPGMHKYLVPETGKWIPEREAGIHAYADLKDAVVRHYISNKLVVPADLDARMQDQRCKSLPPGWCLDSNGRPWHGGAVSGSIGLAELRQGTLTLIEWAMRGAKRVDSAEIKRRSEICAACPYNQIPQGCASCGEQELRNLVGNFVGGQSEPLDGKLNACLVCSCALKAKVRLPLDVLQRHISPEQQTRFPEHCWLKG